VTPLDALFVFVAGLGAGTINTIVGSGTLITFPTLLAVGYPPVLANVSNTVGLVPGSVSGAFGYRRELQGQLPRLVRLGAASALGGITGGLLLLTLPESAFKAIVPVLIAVGCVLVVSQPWISRRLRPPEAAPAHGSALVWALVYLAGVYGGYFGAAQGVLLIAILGLGLAEPLQRINAAKNVLAGLVNAVAAVVFVAVSDVAWAAAVIIAAGSILGGVIGASVGRRLPSPALRGVVALVGVVAIAKLVFFD
jgi:uncharacterized membrane protein YfcA